MDPAIILEWLDMRVRLGKVDQFNVASDIQNTYFHSNIVIPDCGGCGVDVSTKVVVPCISRCSTECLNGVINRLDLA